MRLPSAAWHWRREEARRRIWQLRADGRRSEARVLDPSGDWSEANGAEPGALVGESGMHAHPRTLAGYLDVGVINVSVDDCGEDGLGRDFRWRPQI